MMMMTDKWFKMFDKCVFFIETCLHCAMINEMRASYEFLSPQSYFKCDIHRSCKPANKCGFGEDVMYDKPYMNLKYIYCS